MILVFKIIYLSTHPNCSVWCLSRNHMLSCPILYMDNLELKYADNFKYLGFTFSFDQKDNKDMLRQLRNLHTKSNRLLRLHCCSNSSTDVKIALFRSYCTCFSCPYYWDTL